MKETLLEEFDKEFPKSNREECSFLTVDRNFLRNYFIKAIDQTREDTIRECIYWIKDWWAEDMPYKLRGIIYKLNKLK